MKLFWDECGTIQVVEYNVADTEIGDLIDKYLIGVIGIHRNPTFLPFRLTMTLTRVTILNVGLSDTN